jgi:hypothetical protein
MKGTLAGKRAEERKHGEGINSLTTILRSSRNDVDEKDRMDFDDQQLALQELKRLDREFIEWKRRLETMLAVTHEPFNLGLFQQDDSSSPRP